MPAFPGAVESFNIPRTVQLASQVLPAAAASTAQPFSNIPLGTDVIVFWISYARGAVGGFPALSLQYGNHDDAAPAQEMVLDEGSLDTTSPPFGQMNVLENVIRLPPPQDAAIHTSLLEYSIPLGVTRMRLLAAEFGDPATPGTIAIFFTGGKR